MAASIKPKTQIRLMQYDDIEEISLIDKDSYIYPWSKGIFRDCLLADYYNQVIEIEKTIVGYSVMTINTEGAHILNLCIEKNHRGNGLARRLIYSMIFHTQINNKNKIMLEVRVSNIKAISLYKSLGFYSVGIRQKYYRGISEREDALLLNKKI